MKRLRDAIATVAHYIRFAAINAYVLVRPESLDDHRGNR